MNNNNHKNINWSLILGIIAGVIAIGAAIYFLFIRKKDKEAAINGTTTDSSGTPTNIGKADAFPVTAGYKPTCTDKDLFRNDRARVAPAHRNSFDKMIIETGLYELAIRIRDAECVVENRSGNSWIGYGDSSFIAFESKLSAQDRIKLREVVSKYNTFPQLTRGNNR